MRPRRTPTSNDVIRLPGGNEDSDLHVRRDRSPDGLACIASVWEPSPDERAMLSAGANLELVVYGTTQPPVSLAVTAEQARSQPQRYGETPRLWTELPRSTVELLVETLEDVDGRSEELDSLREVLVRGLALLDEEARSS